MTLGQVEVGAKTNEIPMFAPPLDPLDLRGAVVTADAMHAQRAHAAQLAALPWRDVPVAAEARERAHGRAERRILKVTAVAAGSGFPHAAQAIQIARRRATSSNINNRKEKWTTETVYAITSLTTTQASGAEPAAIIRGHRAIEDRLHWVRDVIHDKTAVRSAPRTAPASWPPRATSPSASCA